MKKRNIIYIAAMLILMVIPIMVDFVRVDISTTFFTDASYWVGVIGVQLPVVLLMFVSRSHAKAREKTGNKQYTELKDTIGKSYAVINNKGLSETFESFVKRDDRERKIKAYVTKLGVRKARVESKLLSFDNAVKRREFVRSARIKKRETERNPWYKWTLRPGKRKALEQKRDRLQELIDSAENNIDYVRIRYVPITTNIIFGETKKRAENDSDMRVHESGEIMTMIGTKALGIVLSSFVVTTFIQFEMYGDVIAIVYRAVITLMQMIMSIYFGTIAGTEFVRGEMMNVARRKVSYIQQFLDKN